jgi:surfactin family lipopeptide synthetase A
MEPDRPVYNELITIHRRGPLDVGILKRTLVEVVRRHEMWRTTFDIVDGEPTQIIQAVPDNIDLPFVDLRGLPSSQRKAEALRFAEEDGHIPFDLRRGPVWRARVVQVEDEYFQLFMTMHQIVMDGVTGFHVLMPEIATIYEAFAAGQPSPLPELPFQYADYALWQRNSMTDSVLAPQIAYWKKRLPGELPVLQWPNDHPRPPLQTFSGATESLTFAGDLMGSLRSMATNE